MVSMGIMIQTVVPLAMHPIMVFSVLVASRPENRCWATLSCWKKVHVRAYQYKVIEYLFQKKNIKEPVRHYNKNKP